MNIGDILKKVGSGIIRNVVPGGGMLIDVVNGFLPDDKKLPNDASAEQVKGTIESLPPEQQQLIMSKQLDVEIEEIKSWTSIQDSLAKADAAGASTRPTIAMMMAWLIVIEVVLFMGVWGYAIATGDTDTLDSLNDSWPLVVAVVATPTALLRAYFGMRTKEKEARYKAANGQQIGGGLLDLLRK